jgi:anionic cell wall polymer biosynthesis LytR-Cps2A-Psr (LCP) family protein
MSALTQAIQTSVTLSSGWDVTSFAEQLQGLTSGAIQFATIPTGDNVMMGADGDVTVVSPAQIEGFVRGLTGTAQDATPTTAPDALTGPTTATTSTTGVPTPATSSTSPATDTPITAGGIRCVD